MTVFKTIFWTSVVWALALVGLWFGADYEVNIAQLWAMATPQAAQQFLMPEVKYPHLDQKMLIDENFVGEVNEDQNQNSEALSGESVAQNPTEQADIIVVDEQNSASITYPDTNPDHLSGVIADVEVQLQQPAFSAEMNALQQQLNFYKSRAEVLEYYLTILLNEKADQFGLPTQIR